MSEVRLALQTEGEENAPRVMQAARRSVEGVVKRLPLVRKHGTREARVLVVERVGKQKSVGHVSPRDFSQLARRKPFAR